MENLTEDFYLEGYQLAITNAKAHQSVAAKAVEIGEYGIARSLYILSAEEAIKAAFVLTNSLMPDQKSEGWDKIFSNHKEKHKHITLFTFLMTYSVKQFDELSQGLGQFAKGIPQELITKALESHPMLAEEMAWVQKQKEKPLIFQEAMEWWKIANNEKNNGFYVGEANNTWRDPRTHTSEQLNTEKRFSEAILEYVEKFSRDVRTPHFKEVLKENPQWMTEGIEGEV